MTRVLFSTEKPKAEVLWSELQYWQGRARHLLAADQRGEAHLVMKQELAPRMRQWSEVCGLSQALQKARLRHLLRALPSDLGTGSTVSEARDNRPTVQVTAAAFRPVAPRSERPGRIPFDDIPGIIDALHAAEEPLLRNRSRERISA